jgi:hypothetical protein
LLLFITQWGSTYDADFLDKPIDMSANKAMANAVSGMFNGPTISWGKIAGLRATDVAAMSTMKQQQQLKQAAAAANNTATAAAGADSTVAAALGLRDAV